MTRLGERLRDATISGRIASTGSATLLIATFHRNTPPGKRQRRLPRHRHRLTEASRERNDKADALYNIEGEIKGAPGLAFETWDPSNQFPLETPTLSFVIPSEADLSRRAVEGSAVSVSVSQDLPGTGRVPQVRPTCPGVPWGVPWDENDGAKPLHCFYTLFTPNPCDHHSQ